MSGSPDISVVMSVFNGASHLRETVDSILSQQGVSFEFIIVNDGSTDQSAQILEDYARRDSRLKIIHQQNQGLTRALIKGCTEAQGKYITRQDVGDISSNERLIKQFTCIEQNPGATLVSCGTHFVGPQGEFLYDVNVNPAEATEALLTLELNKVRGPSHHSSTIFSKEEYEQVGGYRAAFYFAQDLDLWIRLGERGEHIVMADTLYQATINIGSISGLYRKEQLNLTKLMLESARLRRNGLSDLCILERAQVVRPSSKRQRSRLAKAKVLYFIGSCLRKHRNPLATSYLRQALKTFPLHLKAIARLLY